MKYDIVINTVERFFISQIILRSSVRQRRRRLTVRKNQASQSITTNRVDNNIMNNNKVSTCLYNYMRRIILLCTYTHRVYIYIYIEINANDFYTIVSS